MEFNEKLQELRKRKNITQEELANMLYVSRTAISKWESGRGYPNINSLKAIAKIFSVTVDELLSGDKLLDIAEEESRQKENILRSLVFGLLDISFALLFFMPVFGQRTQGAVDEVTLLALSQIAPYLKLLYYIFVIVIVLWGILTLALQNFNTKFRQENKERISLILNALGVILFIISLQPYVATFLFVFLVIKVLMLVKKK